MTNTTTPANANYYRKWLKKVYEHAKKARGKDGVGARLKNAGLSGLQNCTTEAAYAINVGVPTAPLSREYYPLLSRLDPLRESLPVTYQKAAYDPFMSSLRQLGPEGFGQVMANDNAAALLLDIAKAIVQNVEHHEEIATDAFQEVVSDLYDGYLSNADRAGVKLPDYSVVPPLVIWGNPDFGPYTYPVTATSMFGLTVGIVSLPPAHSRSGLVAWAALPHEVSGHDLLHADRGLRQDLALAVRSLVDDSLRNSEGESTPIGSFLASYWVRCLDEAASDVLGILNMEPGALIGLIAYFRAIRSANGAEARLSRGGPLNGPHPTDIMRGMMGAAAVSALLYPEAPEDARQLVQETIYDLGVDKQNEPLPIILDDFAVPAESAMISAQAVAHAIMFATVPSLEYTALAQIQNWRSHDQLIVSCIQKHLTSNKSLPELEGIIESDFYAAHVVAASVLEAANSSDAHLGAMQMQMINLLKVMHDANPTWRQKSSAFTGNVERHRLAPMLSRGQTASLSDARFRCNPYLSGPAGMLAWNASLFGQGYYPHSNQDQADDDASKRRRNGDGTPLPNLLRFGDGTPLPNFFVPNSIETEERE